MSGNEVNMDRRRLREYLLGRMPEEAASELDSSLFEGDVLRQRLEDEQMSLVEDSVYGRLSDAEERTFQEQCARSPLLREQTAALRLLLSALERQQERLPAPSFFSHMRILPALSTAMALVLCVAVFFHVRERHHQPAQISQITASHNPGRDDEQQSGPGAPTAVAFLSANVVRGPSSLPAVKIPPAGTILELQVEVRSPAPAAGGWEVALLRDEEVVQSSTHVVLQRLGQENYLSVRISASSLRAGSYSVRYAPEGSPDQARRLFFRTTE